MTDKFSEIYDLIEATVWPGGRSRLIFQFIEDAHHIEVLEALREAAEDEDDHAFLEVMFSRLAVEFIHNPSVMDRLEEAGRVIAGKAKAPA